MKKIFNTINKFMIEISEDNINAHAAASAFYMFLSLVPFVALLTAIIPYTGLSQETLFNAVERYMPDALQAIIESVVTDIYFAPGRGSSAVDTVYDMAFKPRIFYADKGH